ncbi:chemotaxis protein CheA [Oxobacter pfennigii]|uniref:Chemotaxis protein CheA n=1 Tax=Oxobacter pfennigii TaxID=36849 RepID=A0A0P8WAB4_9CLOT|nr:chemotaxis protein CheA [Oxobacter pfennigii]KPU44653.1 chemotaxis protein CheA [Oxobacter pfennigii]
MDTSQYLTLFLEESAENIENLNQSMLELEKEPQNIEIVNEIFRYAHTLKGMSATMGFGNISELTHTMENVLDKLRNGSLKVSTELITILFKCIDHLEKMVDGIRSGGSDSLDYSDIKKKLLNILDQKPQESEVSKPKEIELNIYDKNVLKEAKDRLYSAYNISVIIRETCQMKSVRAYMVFNNLSQHGEIVKSDPTAEQIEKDEIGDIVSLIYLTQREESFVKELIESISEIEEVLIEQIDFNSIEQSVKAEVVSSAATQIIQDNKSEAPSNENAAAAPKKLGQSVRVDLDRLDKFMNLVGELVIHRTRLEQISSSNHVTELNETLEQVGRITSDLQDLVMKVRMIPLERIFSRYPRMVRDLSTELNKEINFVIKGQETELDRTVVDELGETMIHMLRNSIDHGIESREERIAAGKNPIGNLTITAYQEGNKGVIKVEDDGRGLNLEKIKAKAASKGINVDGMSDTDVKNLIFMEGLSTSEKVTDVSGRGVGMDVVKTKVASIGGSIEVKTESGKGTSFIVNIPLTLSIIQALLVKVGSESFAISLGFIDTVITVEKSDISYTNGKEVVVYRNEIIPIIRIADKLMLDAESADDGFLVIVKAGDKQVGLMVDSLIGQQEIVIKPLGKSMKNLKEYVGATILGDGHVTLILDVVSIV